jgi:signal transduction histidine kinase
MTRPTDYKLFYHTFQEISRLIHSGRTLREVMQRVVSKCTEVLNARGALLRIHNPQKGQFEVAAAYGVGENYLTKGPVPAQSILEELNGTKTVVVFEDIWKAPRSEDPRQAWENGIRMLLDVPLRIDLEIIGLLRIYLGEKREFSEEEKSFLVYIAEQCGCAINKTRYIERQRAQYDQLAIRTEKLAALGRMSAAIAHEINNPLAGIMLFSTNLSKKVPPEGPIREGLDIIVQESKRCKTIIQDLLEFSREKEPQKYPENINRIIQKALGILGNEFRLKQIRVETELSDNLATTLLDENLVEQLFVNLLLNAVHAIEDRQGRIAIRSRMDPEKQRLIVEIEDDGPGIAKEHMDKIFEPFFSTKPNGTGLGLAVCYGIVEKHHGNIEVFSKPGEGARFLLQFPVLRNPEEE